jgi:hypothetical protein
MSIAVVVSVVPALADDGPLILSISADHTIKIGQPVKLSVTFENKSGHSVWVPLPLGGYTSGYDVHVWAEKSTDMQLTPLGHHVFKVPYNPPIDEDGVAWGGSYATGLLEPGEHDTREFDADTLYEFDHPGVYNARAEYHLGGREIKSNIVTFVIVK